MLRSSANVEKKVLDYSWQSILMQAGKYPKDEQIEKIIEPFSKDFDANNAKLVFVAGADFGTDILSASFQRKSGIIYLNICDFLLALNKHKDLQIAMDELG